jgi:hypothetical protein
MSGGMALTEQASLCGYLAHGKLHVSSTILSDCGTW